MDWGKTGTRLILRTLAVFSVIAIPAAAQYQVYDLGLYASTKDIQADNTGAVHLVWTEDDVLYYGRIFNNALTGQVEVARGVSNYFWRPYVSVRPDGSSVHIAWCTDGYGNTVMHSWRDSAGVWRTEPVYQVPSNQNIAMPSCAVDGAGQVHVLFGIWDNVGQWYTLFTMRRLAGGQWGGLESFAPYYPEHTFPMMFTDSRGNVHATWCIVGCMGADCDDVYYCTAPSGGKLDYSSRVKIPKGPGSELNGFGDLYVDRNGVVHRAIGVWSWTKQKMRIDHTKKLPGGSFSVPTQASINFLNLAHCDPVPTVVAVENGKTIVAWGQIGKDGSNQVKASVYNPASSTWTLGTVDPTAGIPAGENRYRVAMTRTDTHLYGVWRSWDGRLKLIVMSMDGSLPPDLPSPPSPEPSPPPPSSADPVASITASPTSGTSPLAVTFNGLASYDSDGSIVSYSWSFGDGGTAAGAIVTHTYTSNGTFTARLTVTDNAGNTDGATRSIRVLKPNEVPVADFKFTPQTGIYPCEITFNGGRSHDPDGKIVQYSWDFGDGVRASGQVVNHTYTRWGSFSVSLTVRDNRDATHGRSREITIRRLFQPLNISWVTHKDESLFQTRLVNQVSWDRNSANDGLGVQIVLHRIWRKRIGESNAAFRPIAEVTGDVFSYMDKSAISENTYAYTVTVCDNQGHESPILR